MQTHAYHTGRTLAITCGIAATAGAIGLLLADAIDTGRWTQEHALVPLVVGLTVATGYLASTALWRARLLAAIGFAVAFAIGTTITVLNGVGRQSEGVAVRMAEASRHNKVVADKAADLNRARLRLEQANQMAEREMTGSRCGVRCNDWKLRAIEVGAHIQAIEAELAGLGAVRPVNPKAAKVGEIAATFGFDGKRASALVLLIEPLLVPLLLEWTAITAFGYGFGQDRSQGQQVEALRPMHATVQTHRTPSSGRGRRGRKPDPKIVDFVARFREKTGKAPSGSEIKAGIPGIATSTAYDYAKRA